MNDYSDFLAGKIVRAPMRGLDHPPAAPAHLFPYQAACVDFGLRAGSWGCYLSTGLGKTRCELAWSAAAAEASGRPALILTPLAVARQIEAEGRRLGYDVRVIREQAEARQGINVCNYDRLDLLQPEAFGAVALDEAGILKAFTGATSRALRERFAGHRWRMAATATPAPNDHMELGQQAEFLGVMPSNEMLMRWFTADQKQMGRYRLKSHGVTAFWDWMGSWARMAEHPRDLGDSVPGFDLPALHVHRHRVEGPDDMVLGGAVEVSATTMHDVKRRTAAARAAVVAELVHGEPGEPWLVWCDTDYEADDLLDVIGGAPGGVRDVRGSMKVEAKEAAIWAFLDGSARVLVTKPSIAGWWGLNLQHCARMAFVGRSFSYELWFQAVRRCWRFGQARPVNVHLVVAEGEDQIGRVIDRKAEEHQQMTSAMTAAMRRASQGPALRVPYNPTFAGHLPAWMQEAS